MGRGYDWRGRSRQFFEEGRRRGAFFAYFDVMGRNSGKGEHRKKGASRSVYAGERMVCG